MQAPDRILGYPVVRELPTGGDVGARYLVRSPEGRFFAAVRVSFYSGDREEIVALRRAAEAAMTLHDPRLVRIVAVEEENDHLVILREAPNGGTLQELHETAPEGRLPLAIAVTAIRDAARALATLPGAGLPQGIVPAHRGLTLDRVHVDYDGRVRVLDALVGQALDLVGMHKT